MSQITKAKKIATTGTGYDCGHARSMKTNIY